MRREVNTVSLLIAGDRADEANSLIRTWFREGWQELGNELAQWFGSAESRQRLAPALPHGALLEAYDVGSDTTTTRIDQDLDDSFWNEALSRLQTASQGSIGAYGQVQDETGLVTWGNTMQTMFGLNLHVYRHSASSATLQAHARKELFLTPERQDRTLRFLHAIADGFDLAYGEIAYTPVHDGLTAMDYARNLFGDPDHPMDALYATSRQTLRGYGWITIVPKELAPKIRTTSPFHEAHTLATGGLWLQATPLFTDYDQAASNQVAAALVEILPEAKAFPSLAQRVLISTE